MAIMKARRADDFIDSVGINTHWSWAGAWDNKDRVLQVLKDSGIRHARDGVPYAGWTLPYFERAADFGVKWTIIPSRDEFNKTQDFSIDMPRIDALARSRPNSVGAIEGLNEINTWPATLNGSDTARNLSLGRVLQQRMWEWKNRYPSLVNVPLLCLTVGGMDIGVAAAAFGDMSAWCDYGTWHNYFGQGDQPRKNLTDGYHSARRISPNKPCMVTEAGYYTAVNDMSWGGGGVDYPTQAKLIVNMVLQAFDIGWSRCYVFLLLDNNTDLNAANDIEASLGIYRGDGSPKPAGTALRRLLDGLRDTAGNAATFSPGSLDYTLSGLPGTAKHLLFQRANGTFVIAVWNEADVWDQANRRAINAAPVSVKLTLGQPATSIAAMVPFDGSGSKVAGTAEFAFPLADHAVLLTVTGLGAVAPVPAPVTPPPVTPVPKPPTGVVVTSTIGAGERKLVLRLTQDEWNGMAQYTVAIDGKQIGGTLSAGAPRGSGAADTLTVLGSWAPGAHKAEVTFLNDAYGGVPGTDRNLYLESATLDGVAVPGAKLDMLSGGTQGFSFTVPAAVPAPPPAPVPAPTPDLATLIAAGEALVRRMTTAAAADLAAAKALQAELDKVKK